MRICVYGASSNAIGELYKAKTYELGMKMAERKHDLVYGAGAQGVMGSVARGVQEHGGKVLGVSPDFFKVDGVLFDKCTEIIFTKTMRERKQIMEDSADAFIVAPGGCGTFEEFFEILTLKQLERHNKAIVIFNVNRYYDKLIAMMDQTVEQKFTKPATRLLYHVTSRPDEALDYIEKYVPETYVIKNLRHVEDGGESPFVFDVVRKKDTE